MSQSNEIKQFRAVEDKLRKLLSENNLIYTFKVDSYPITLTINQDADPSAQMELYETTTDGVSARDSKLQIIFRDGSILIRTDSRIVISDELMNKIKGYAKKMHYLYLQALYRNLIVDQDGGTYLPLPDYEIDA